MSNFYSDDDLAKMAEECSKLAWRRMSLQQRCLEYGFKSLQAREFAHHGFARRLSTIVSCIKNTFTAVPPELDGLPTAEALQDAEIQLQAFISSVFGCLDNLARVWVLERNIRRPNGKHLAAVSVGLRPKNVDVRNSLTRSLREYLEDMTRWFEYLEDYRDALAHRIPLYIPPYTVPLSSRYKELEAEIESRVSQGKAAEDLRREQDGLKVFRPIMVHSLEVPEPMLMGFHLQMLRDYKTVEAIGSRILDDLQSA